MEMKSIEIEKRRIEKILHGNNVKYIKIDIIEFKEDNNVGNIFIVSLRYKKDYDNVLNLFKSFKFQPSQEINTISIDISKAKRVKCTKIVYETKEIAHKKAAELNHKYAEEHKQFNKEIKGVLRPYKCPNCGKIHLTSISKNEIKETKFRKYIIN
jgi:hypothetical protein